ncbi:unnamed protein product [Penicillium roqueforti FM164]|uniref:Genomic scaffold, ProqFM164S04 n=1 Tax=Penicillium roqueforti (strain FM164) TaxID=1365484 RepID=W6QF95_PENRF|nr:unnamed protein product [Penicillium roqueforti FM164]
MDLNPQQTESQLIANWVSLMTTSERLPDRTMAVQNSLVGHPTKWSPKPFPRAWQLPSTPSTTR